MASKYREAVVAAAFKAAIRVLFPLLAAYRVRFGPEYESDPDRPWLKEYQVFGIPETIEPYPDEPVHRFLYDAAAADHPEQGIIQRGRRFTYPEILENAERLATALAERGVGKGDRVATVLPTSVQFVIADYGISMTGGVHVPNDFLDAESDLVYRLEQSEADVLIGQDAHRELLFRLRDELDIDHLVLTDLDDYSAEPPDAHDDIDGVEWLTDVLAETQRDPPSVTFDVEEDVHTLLFTGGTTGRPKGCMLSHRNLTANVLQADSLAGSLLSSSVMMALPMYHAYGYTTTHGLIQGGDDFAVIDDPRDTARMRALIEEYGLRMVTGVPTQFMELLREQVDRKLIATSGSAPLASETKGEFERDNLAIAQGYGLSEMSPTTHADIRGFIESLAGMDSTSSGFDQPSIGIPLPDTEVKLVDVDTGEPVPIGRAVEEGLEGEMYLNGPQRMLGYLAQEDPFDEEGFIPTGDVVRIDDCGRFYVVDRVKNMVNVSGLKVYTNEVDDVLQRHPGVRRPATIGIPDPDRPGSERVKVYIEAEPEYDGDLTAADVREHLDGEVPRQAMPSEVEFLDEMPLTDVGKIDKESLKDRHGDRVDQAA